MPSTFLMWSWVSHFSKKYARNTLLHCDFHSPPPHYLRTYTLCYWLGNKKPRTMGSWLQEERIRYLRFHVELTDTQSLRSRHWFCHSNCNEPLGIHYCCEYTSVWLLSGIFPGLVIEQTLCALILRGSSGCMAIAICSRSTLKLLLISWHFSNLLRFQYTDHHECGHRIPEWPTFTVSTKNSNYRNCNSNSSDQQIAIVSVFTSKRILMFETYLGEEEVFVHVLSCLGRNTDPNPDFCLQVCLSWSCRCTGNDSCTRTYIIRPLSRTSDKWISTSLWKTRRIH